MDIQKQTGYRRGQAYALNNLADLLTVSGDFSEARKLAEQSLALRKELGRKHQRGRFSQQELGWIAFQRGRASRTRKAICAAQRRPFKNADLRDKPGFLQRASGRAFCLLPGKTAEAGRLAGAAQEDGEEQALTPAAV